MTFSSLQRQNSGYPTVTLYERKGLESRIDRAGRFCWKINLEDYGPQNVTTLDAVGVPPTSHLLLGICVRRALGKAQANPNAMVNSQDKHTSAQAINNTNVKSYIIPTVTMMTRLAVGSAHS
jgi:hypothetical protein